MNETVKRQRSFSPTPYVVVGFSTIALTFGVLGGWAFTAPLASAVVATGVVTVESSRKTIQHLEGGIVGEILVRESQLVKAGDVLVKLLPTQAKATQGMYSSRFDLLQATEARLEAERSDQPEIKFPERLLKSDSDEIKQALQSQQNLFQDRKLVRDGQIGILRARMDQSREEIKGLEVQRDATKEQQESIAQEIERLTSAGQVIGKNQIASLDRDRLVMQGNYGRFLSEIARIKQNIVESELQILQVGQEYRERAANELKEMRPEMSEVTERLVVAKDTMERTVIRAPINGVVQNIKFHTTGGVIRPAETIMEIVPVDDKLIVNAHVRPLDIDSIDLGDSAEVRFPAFSSRTIPLIEGQVRSISPDLIYPDNGREEPYYLARVEVDEPNVPAEIKGRLIPGMPSDVIIATGERTMANYLIRPLEDAIAKSMREE